MTEILNNSLDELDLISRQTLHFQQDVHNYSGTYQLLRTIFNHHWIGTRGPFQSLHNITRPMPSRLFVVGLSKDANVQAKVRIVLDTLKTMVRKTMNQIDNRATLNTVRAVEKGATKPINRRDGLFFLTKNCKFNLHHLIDIK